MCSLKLNHLIKLDKISDPRGNLTFIENRHLPFEIKRVYYLYDVMEELKEEVMLI